MPEDHEYFANKRPDQTYISRAFDALTSSDPVAYRKMRILSKVFDSAELHQFVQVKGEVVLRVTPAERQEVRITFYEDPREVDSITIQRYTKKTGKPHRWHFTFRGEEIDRLCQLLRLVQYYRLGTQEKQKLDDHFLDALLVNTDEKRHYFLQHLDLVVELATNNITKSDIIALAYRKRQLEIFELLLADDDYFEDARTRWGKRGHEAVWQQFFENNAWIFGYGLNYVFTSALADRTLEQMTTGHSVEEAGKRIDALMRTRGLISSLCFIELKTHKTPLLAARPYRSECWSISSDLAGSIAQVQKTVQKAVRTIQTKLELHTDTGDPTGEIAFVYAPKAYVVIGSLDEFVTSNGINERKFGSFELFRRNLDNPEVITFDELLERARFIVRHSEEETPPGESAGGIAASKTLAIEEIPF